MYTDVRAPQGAQDGATYKTVTNLPRIVRKGDGTMNRGPVWSRAAGGLTDGQLGAA